MRKKQSLLYFLFIINCIITFGQKNNQIEFSGCVFDNTSNKTIPYVNIYLKKDVSSGVVSNDKGRFLFYNNNIKDTVVFSCIGYKTKAICLADLERGKEIFLEPESYSIEEVQVQAKKREFKTKEIGYFSKKVGYSIAFTTGARPTIKIENPFNEKDVRIRSIKFSIRKPFGSPLPVRVRLYEIDSKDEKGAPLFLDNLIYQNYNTEETEVVKIDIFDKNIKLPPKGVFVEVEALNLSGQIGSRLSCAIGIDGQFGKFQIGLEVDVFKD